MKKAITKFGLFGILAAGLFALTSQTAKAQFGNPYNQYGGYSSCSPNSYYGGFQQSGPVYHPPSVHYHKTYHPTSVHWTPGQGLHTHGHFDYTPHYTPGHFDYQHGNHIHGNPYYHNNH